jgi:hypothetical protein
MPRIASLRVSHPDVLRTYLQRRTAEGELGRSLVKRGQRLFYNLLKLYEHQIAAAAA